jgi:nucleoid DNA-binding protein
MAKKLQRFHNRFIVEWIKVYLFDEYPDIQMEDFLIESIFMGFLDFVQAGMEAEEDVLVPSLGKFVIKKKENKYGNMQYYIKFKPSRHLVLNFRESKGTLTEAEKIDIEKKRKFIQSMWDKKQQRIAAALEREEQKKAGVAVTSDTMQEIRKVRKSRKKGSDAIIPER